MDSTVAELITHDFKIAYVVTDTHLHIVEISPNAIILFDEPSHMVMAASLVEAIPELTGNEPALQKILNGTLPRFEIHWVNRETEDRQRKFLSLSVLPYRNSDNAITGVVVLAQDVTPMGETHQQLNQHRNELRLLRNQLLNHNAQLAMANAELRHLDEVKSTFISVAAHELQTPLSSINGFIEMLLDEVYGPVNDEQKEALDIVQRSATRLINIIKNLLDVTRIEAGRIELALRPTDLTELIELVAAEFRPQIEAKQQNLTVQFQPNLPFVLCDHTRTIQIVGNLLSNAIKYTPSKGSITLNTELAKAEGFLKITVKDTGVGMSQEDQAMLFKRFFRAESANVTGENGTGLGLYITRSLVELHGGQIWAESELWRGSAFHVTFPIAGQPPEKEAGREKVYYSLTFKVPPLP
ncbi:MAG: PAS domain-containing protein [Anaerolineae bacterium]|nr:PAS domain-containing protein [Anaerolineae bacterium]